MADLPGFLQFGALGVLLVVLFWIGKQQAERDKFDRTQRLAQTAAARVKDEAFIVSLTQINTSLKAQATSCEAHEEKSGERHDALVNGHTEIQTEIGRLSRSGIDTRTHGRVSS